MGGRGRPFPAGPGTNGGEAHIGFFAQWLTAGAASPGTVALRCAHLRRFAKRAPIVSATAEHVLDWLSDPNLKPSTRRSYRTTLKLFYEWQQLTGRREDNPTAMTRPIAVPRSQPRPASSEALDVALSNACQEDRLALLLAAYAGLRRAEIAGLHADDVEGSAIRIVGKGGVVRYVPIHDRLRRDLVPWAARGGFLFRGRDGASAVSADAMGRRISRLLASGAHSLRHKFATDAYRGSRDLRAVQELLGHASVTTTQVYTQVGEDAMAAAVNSIAG